MIDDCMSTERFFSNIREYKPKLKSHRANSPAVRCVHGDMHLKTKALDTIVAVWQAYT